MSIMDEARDKVRPKNKATPKSETRIVPNIICMADVSPEEIKWLWPGRLALGKLSLLAGRPGLGKSFLTCDMAARISNGWKWPCSEDHAPLGDVLLISGEDDPADTIRPRLDALEANVNRVHVFKAATIIEADGKESTIPLDLSNVNLLHDALAKLPECKLVVVDPIGSYLGGQVDAHRENEVRAVLSPLTIMAAQHGACILLVAHPPKSVSGNADDNVLGSRAFTGIVRSVFHLVADKDNNQRRLLLAGKNNIGAMAPGLAFTIDGNPARVEWELEPLEGMYADDAMSPVGSSRGPEPNKLNQAIKWLKACLAQGPMTADDIEAAAGKANISLATIKRAKEKLGITSRKREFFGKWLWSLPEEDQVAPEEDQESRRGPSSLKLGPLRENLDENSCLSAENLEEDQVSGNLVLFDEDRSNLANMGDDPEWEY